MISCILMICIHLCETTFASLWDLTWLGEMNLKNLANQRWIILTSLEMSQPMWNAYPWPAWLLSCLACGWETQHAMDSFGGLSFKQRIAVATATWSCDILGLNAGKGVPLCSSSWFGVTLPSEKNDFFSPRTLQDGMFSAGEHFLLPWGCGRKQAIAAGSKVRISVF